LGVVLLGIMLSLVIFVLGFTFTYDAVAGVKDAIDWVTSGMTAGISPLRIVIEAVSRLAPLGAVITLVVCAVALLLTWVQLSRRMPSYVKAWNGERKKTRQKPPLPATTTPPRTVLLPTGLSVIALVVILRFQFTPQWIPAIYGILWPVGLLVLAIWVHKTIQMKPQPAMTDHHVHISAAGMQSTGLILAGVLAGQPLVSSLPILLGTVLLIGGQLYYLPDVSRWCDETTGPLQYLDTLWILSFLIPLIVIGAVQYGSPWIGVLLSAIPVSFGGLKAIQRYRSTNQ
jgi:hypothetical protein